MVAVAVEFAPAGSSTWTALTCKVFGIGWARGASEDRGVIAVPSSGECVAYLIDPSRDLDPSNASSSLGAGVFDLGVAFRVKLAGAVAFLGVVDQIRHDLNPPPTPGVAGVPIARIAAIDGAATAAGVSSVLNLPYPPETTMQRVAHLLDGAGVAVGARTIDAGGEPIQAAPALTNDVWSDLIAVIQNELGSIEFRPDGSVIARTRHTVWTPSAPVLHLGCDDPDSTAELALSSLALVSDRGTIRNLVDAARAGGTSRTTQDVASQAKYGLRSTTRHDLQLVDDAQVDAWSAFALNRTKTPTRGLEQATVDATDAGVALVEAVPLFTGRVHVYQDHYGPPVNRVVRLLGVAWDVDDLANATATLTLGSDTAPVSTARSFGINSAADWAARLVPPGDVWLAAGYVGFVGWAIDPATGALRVANPPASGFAIPNPTGGVVSLLLTWTAIL